MKNLSKIKLDGCFSSKQCLPSSREGGFITQVKGEDYANCYGIGVLKYVNVSHIGLIMDKLSLTKGMWIQQKEGDHSRPSGQMEALSSMVGPCIYYAVHHAIRLTVMHLSRHHHNVQKASGWFQDIC